jgi:hypothetical protein
MATRVGSAVATYGSLTFTSAYSQSPTAGNLLLMGVSAEHDTTTPTCTTPSGWTAGPTGVAHSGAGVFGKLLTFWKVAAGGDAVPSVTTNSATNAYVVVEEWSGLTATPHDADSTVGMNTQNSTAAGSCDSGPLTTTNANDWIWSCLSAYAGDNRTLTWGGGSTADSRFDTGNFHVATATQDVSTTGTYTPTLAFASGSANWYVSATASMSFKQSNVAPNAPTLNSPATGTTVDRGVTQRLAWTFSDPNVGDNQSAFSLRYRIGAGAWTTVTGTTTNSFWDAAPATFSAATYEWQVNTKDAAGLQGPNSASSFFTAADAPGVPSITAPTSGSTVGTATATVTWSGGTQTDYQIRKVADIAGVADTTTVYYDSGDVVDSSTRSATIAFGTNLRWEHIQVRVKAGGLWSSWADCRVYVSFTSPMVPTLTATPNSSTASISVVITNPTPSGGAPAIDHNDVFVSSPLDAEIRVATSVANNGTFLWKFSGAVRVYTFRVVAVGTNGTTRSS